MKRSLFVLFGTLLIVGYTLANTIHVDELNGRNSPDCIKGQSPCLTLQYAINKTGNNTLFLLDSTVVTITDSIQVYLRENITIVGEHSTIVQCMCSNLSDLSCGLMFVLSSKIVLRELQVHQCSLNITITTVNEDILMFSAGLFFRSCINVTIDTVTVSSSIGFGLFLLNCVDGVNLRWSNFIGNSIIDCYNKFGGGGALVLINGIIPFSNTGIKDIHSSRYSIVESNFTNNHQNTNGSLLHDYYLLYGGGLNIVLSHNVSRQVFSISNCGFTNNTSVAGGGVAVSVREGACNNTLKFHNCQFVNNNGGMNHVGGGGGMTITLYHSKKPGIIENYLNISKCLFMNNMARYGGGIALAAGHSHLLETNHVYFEKCTWTNNHASLSSAVDISPEVRFQDMFNFNTAVHFSNCEVLGNFPTTYIDNGTSFKGRGAFLVARLRVTFSGNMVFNYNNATALYLDFTYLNVKNDSSIEFIGNEGEVGGAIMMKGFSGLRYDNNVIFTFTNNTSKYSGGAIYNENTDQHLIFHSHMCIFIPNKKYIQNVNFEFMNNHAEASYGQSIYITCIDACRRFCSETNNIPIRSLDNPFAEQKCFGNLSFSENNTIATNINTLEVHDTTNGSDTFLLKAIPGKSIDIPLKSQDDFGRKTTNKTAFYVRLLRASQKNTQIDAGSNIINNDNIVIYGQPGTNGTIMFSAMLEVGIFVTLNFTLLQCPPGFISVNGACECSATGNSTYYGITGCKKSSGLLLPGNWAGYIFEKASEDTLFTGNCPQTYCNPIKNKKANSVYQGRFLLLTPNASKLDLEKLICAENRRGTLCGRCTNGTSVFYHSDILSCKCNNKYCKFSWIFYFLSDLVPIAVLFGILLVLNVSLTSGSAYSIIMMMQLMRYLQISAKGAITFGNIQHRLMALAIVMYDFSNLEFLSIERLSFCLWPTAQTLDIMIMKYVAVLFSMFLVILFVVLMNKCSCRCIKKLCRRNSESQYSMVEGLTAFLVLCYTQTTNVTFEILNRGSIYGKGSSNDHPSIHVAFLDGETNYLKGIHLRYAIPALLFLILIVIPTPLLLICDPYLLKLEDRFSQQFTPWTRLRIRLKPFCDSFQNCFRNNMRFSAGFYFLYRFVLLSLFSFTSSMFQFLYWTQIVLILLVTFHSILQPFKLKSDNIIASMCFCYMAMVNGLTLILYNSVTNDGYSMETAVLQWIQVAFLYLPIVFGMSWAVKHVAVKAKQKFFAKKLNEVEDVGELFEHTTSSNYSYQTLQ